METAFEYVPVTMGSAAFAAVDEINREAFPAVERVPLEDLVRIGETYPSSVVNAVYEQGECVGFFHVIERENFVYGTHFAVSAKKRGQGYGTRIMKAILEFCKGKPFIGGVEYPDEDAENYEQRVARIRFYERLGIYNTYEIIDFKDRGGRFYLIASAKDAPIEEFRAFVAEVVKLREKIAE